MALQSRASAGGLWGSAELVAFLLSSTDQMSTIQIVDPANTVLTNLCGPATRITYAALSDLSSVPVSTLWDRAHGRQSRSEKAAKQQYLTPQEEKALVSYALRMSRNGYPLPVKIPAFFGAG